MATKKPSKDTSTTTAASATARAPKAPRARRTTSTTRRKPKPLVAAAPENCFWVHYGPVLKDLRELRDALAGQISEAQFAHHVRATHNDFANWVDRVLGERPCARALRKTHSVAAALAAVEAALRDR